VTARVYSHALPADDRRAADVWDSTAQLLEAFEALPEDEKRVFTVEFLRRAVPFDSGQLDDSETADAADQLLASLE
jgi:hypothetical protein